MIKFCVSWEREPVLLAHTCQPSPALMSVWLSQLLISRLFLSIQSAYDVYEQQKWKTK